MEITKKPFRYQWKWSLLTAFGVWAFVVVIYVAGFVPWKDVTFVHTFIWPAVMLVALVPLSIPIFADSKWFMPGMGAWMGVTIPGVYIGGSWVAGFENHCGKVATLGGIVAFLALNILWVISRRQGWALTEQERSIDSQVRVAPPTRSDATRETVQPVF
jgi:hypothetical protein